MSEGKESPEQLQRLIDWNVDVLLKLLKQVVAKREATGKGSWDDEPVLELKETIAEEVVDIIVLPPFDPATLKHPKSVDVAPQAKQQLKEFVTAIASAYHPNPYHCLQHASHVATAVTKLLSRIAVSDFEGSEGLASHIHNNTYGIVSDPLTQFAVVLSALIHAVDHRGISNDELAKEDPELSAKYKGVGLIEQLSIEKAWNKFMDPNFEGLRRCLYADLEEKKRFREVLVNSAMATDIANEQFRARRQARWDLSFGPAAAIEEDLNRKATCVIECLMQSADVFHTMQHWHVYVKWNERGFEEANKAYKAGRIASDPAKTWYKDELAVFDNFVIPLSMQLKDIDAFVVNSDEYLNYALKNRQRWASNGREIVAALVAKYTTGSATAKTDLIKAISKEGKDEDAITRDAAALRHLQRLVDWNTDVFVRLVKQIVAKREASGQPGAVDAPKWTAEADKSPIDEIAKIIPFAEHNEALHPSNLDVSSVELGLAASSQLKEYLLHISTQYNDNPFHCLDHASQVSMTAKKLLGRLITTSSNLGLSSDPLAQLAVVFACLIHDVDHSGLPNNYLLTEDLDLARKYKNRCITEQHAIDLAWTQLMQPEFEDLCAAICSSDDELRRLRQIVVNSVLATDYFDDELVAIRMERWKNVSGSESDNGDLKATIAVVLLVQAAENFHTIQHWQLYQKWTERHFFEVYGAFEKGRIKTDPSVTWYKTELMFFDEHVIPLCKQMQELGVFGLSADECLAFATTNRQLWSMKGMDLVQGMVDKYQGKEKDKEGQITKRRTLSNV